MPSDGEFPGYDRGRRPTRSRRTATNYCTDGPFEMPISKVLIANRGEIACRIVRSCRKIGLASVAIYSEPDADGCHVREADESRLVGPAAAQRSYLNVDRIMAAGAEVGADAVHPGYGFLAENAAFAQTVIDSDLAWIGPRPETINAMGDKERAREIAVSAGVPVLPGSERFTGSSLDGLEAAAQRIGFPLLIKAAAGGGGIGMKRVDDVSALGSAVRATQGLAKANFGDDAVFLEKYIPHARHIEVQVLGLGDGRAVHVFERECSIQRRYQKIIEEAPSSALDSATRASICHDAVKLARSQGYVSAGTVEFVFDDTTGDYYFLEMNTRIQVEHPVTEMVTNLDLVEHQIRIAANEKMPMHQSDIDWSGHALECRIYAEDPFNNFMPQPGPIEIFDIPVDDSNVRVDSGYESGSRVHPYYDPLVAKLIVKGGDRREAIEHAVDVLERSKLVGIKTNIPFLLNILKHRAFRAGQTRTSFIADHKRELFE